jgi:squalene-associated FAD-dependent desaturase
MDHSSPTATTPPPAAHRSYAVELRPPEEAAPPSAPAIHARERRPVLVVGGGMGGIAAATALTERDEAVVLLEGAPHLGGRARSWRDETTGDVVDNGQHLFMGCYRGVEALLDRVQVPAAARPRFQPMLRVPFIDCDAQQRRSELRLPAWPAPLHLLGGLRLFDAIDPRDRLGALRLAPALLGLTPPSDDLTVDQWLRAHGQSAKVRRALWTPITLAALNEEPAVASAALLSRVLREAFAFGRRDSALGAAPVGLSELYVDPAVRWLRERGAVVHAGAPVSKLLLQGELVAGVELANGDVIEAKSTVLAAPPRAVCRLVEPAQRVRAGWPQLDALQTSPIVSVHLWLDHVVDIGYDFVALLGSPAHWVFDRNRLVGTSAPRTTALSLVISAGRDVAKLERDELLALGLQEIQRAFPAARTARLVHGLAIREKQATLSPAASAYRLRPPVTTPLRGLFVAGDWTATGLPATLEGAARSGHEAAHAVLRA